MRKRGEETTVEYLFLQEVRDGQRKPLSTPLNMGVNLPSETEG